MIITEKYLKKNYSQCLTLTTLASISFFLHRPHPLLLPLSLSFIMVLAFFTKHFSASVFYRTTIFAITRVIRGRIRSKNDTKKIILNYAIVLMLLNEKSKSPNPRKRRVQGRAKMLNTESDGDFYSFRSVERKKIF